MAQTTTYLKLRLSSDLTADARYNLERIDLLASVSGVTATGNIVVRASGSLSLEPDSAAVGGDGVGGTLNLGTSGHTLDAINAYGPLQAHSYTGLMARGVLRAYETDSTNYIGLRAPDTVAADLIFTLPGTDGSAGQVMYTDGTGSLAFASVATSALPENRIDIGAADGTRTQTNTSSVGDILASTAGGLTYKAGSIADADVSGSAAIAYTKLALTGAIVDADISVSAGITRTKLASGTAYRLVVNDASGIISELAALTASRALASDINGQPVASATTAVELGYLAGVTSAVQTQLDARLLLLGGTMLGDLTLAQDPSTSLHAATKQYVDSLVNGIKWKAAVRVATAAAGTLATDFDDGSTIDGVIVATGDRLLVKNQVAGAENGIYVVAASGAPARAIDADAFAELNSACVMVSEGTANADKGFIQTASLTALSDSQTWTQNFGTGLYTASGEGLELSGSTFSLELDGTTLSKSASGLKVASGGVTNTEVSASAAIDYSKLALTGALLSADIAAAEKTGSGDVVLQTGATLVTPTIDDYLEMNEESAPSTPASGKARLYVSTDGRLHILDDAGTDTEVGSGSGSGEKTYIDNPSGASAVTGWTGVGDLDVVRTTTAAELPREYTTASGLKITADANTQSVADYVYYDFTLDDVDLSKKLKIQWSQKVTGTYTAGQLAVVITTQADRTTALHTPLVTAIPAVDGVFVTSFDASTTAALSLVIRATSDMTTDGGIVISDVIVGPGSIAQSAVVSDWLAYTPTGSWVSNTTYTGFYRRVGSNIEVSAKAATSGAPTSATLTFSIPSGLTINTAALTTATANIGTIAGSQAAASDSGTLYRAHVKYNDTTTVSVGYQSNASGAESSVTQAAPFTFGASDYVDVKFSVPIAEWSGSGTLNTVQNDVEYASNSSSTDAADTTSFVYGTAGSIGIIATTALTAARLKRVNFQTPIQATDEFVLEVQVTGSGPWIPVTALNSNAGFDVYQEQNTGTYGMAVQRASATAVDVKFGQYCQATGTTYGAAGASWASQPSAGTRWRVKKMSAGQAVGFGEVTQSSTGLVKSAGQLKGTNTNDLAATGYVGERVPSSGATSGSANSFTTATNMSSMSLTAGSWLIFLEVLGTKGSSTVLEFGISTSVGGAAFDAGSARGNGFASAWSIVESGLVGGTTTRVLELAATTTVYSVAASTGTCTGLTGYMKAIRIR